MLIAHETYGDCVKIEFLPSSDEVVAYIPAPKPAKAYTPKWFAQMPIFAESTKVGNPGYKGLTAKGCMAFLDTFAAGYTQELWCDVHVSTDRGMAKGSRDPQPLHVRPSTPAVPGLGMAPVEFAW